MKVAVVASGHIPSQWAHSINVMKHANAFRRLGHYVEVLSVKGYYEDKFLSRIDNIFKWYGVDEVPLKFFKLPFFVYYKEVPWVTSLVRAINFLTFKRLHCMLDPERHISNYIKDNKFDVCYARSYRVVKYNIQNEIPTIMETHNYVPYKTKYLMDVFKMSNSIYLRKLVTIHSDLRKLYIKCGVPASKIQVLEDAVDLDLFDEVPDDKVVNRKLLNLPLDKKIIMYCGSLKPGKGIHIILDTARKVAFYQDILFIIVGGSKDEVKNWKRYNNYEYTNVKFTGFVEGNLIPYYLKSADVLFMPYDVREKRPVMDINTTSPMKLFEYMAAKRAIITTDIPTIRKILSDESAVIVGDGNYVDAILNILNDLEAQLKMVNNAYKIVQRYTYERRCEQILSLSN